MENGIPIIVPLRPSESYQGRCDELRILLRSVDRNVDGCSAVCVVSDELPAWMRPDAPGLVWVRQGDPYTSCKDANLFLKTHRGMEALGMPARWCFCADDNAFLWPCDLRTLPSVFNGTPRDWFARQSGKWYRRMVNTFDWLAARGVEMPYSHDSHVPQVFTREALERSMEAPYGDGAGFCIYTLWRGLEGVLRGGVYQPLVTLRYASPQDLGRIPVAAAAALPFCTYNDPPFGAGLRERLLALFPEKSRFEK